MLFNNRKGMIARFALFLTLLGGIFGVSSVQAINTAESSFNASGLVAQESDNLSHVQVETALLVKDVNPGAASSGSFDYDFEYMNGMLYLSAGDETFGGELWKSDGTSDGTVLVKDINAGSFSSSLRHLTNVVGMLYFSAYDGIHGHELWKSDGTAEGTALVKDIRPGTNQNTNSSSPNFLTNVSGVLYFAAYDSANGMELWKSDGTAEGTVVVRDINPGSNNSNPENLINVNGTLFFTADDGTHRTELWKSDGTAEGTVLVKDIFPGIVGSYPYHFTDVNGTLYFVAAGDLNGYDDYELWKSDGTSAGTTLVKDIWPGVYPSYPDEFENVNGILYFEASDGVHGNELWKTNGTSAGTVMVKDIWPGERGWGSDITHVGTTVYFGAQDGLDYSLWKSDGTSAGTVKVAGPGPSDITSANGIVYYSASDGIHGYELWKSDGTASGTELVRDINPTGDSWPDLFFDANGTLYFRANDGVHGTELWKIGWGDPPPPTSTPSITPSPIFTLTPSATPGPITISGTTGVEGVTLSYFDGADKTVISDSNGDYVISIVANSWSGTVRPFKPDYRFWPTTRSYSNITGSVSNSDYTAERLFTISGNAGAAGAILSYTDGTAKSVTADSNGIYSIQVPENWTGMVAPYKSHYRFTPANRTFSNVRADQPNQDFTAQRVVFISGSTGISGVTLSYTDGIPKTVTSGSGGNYWIEVRENWSGTIIPSKTGFIFTPSSRAYSDMVDDRLSENYTWSPIVTNVNDSGAGSLRQAISNAISGTTIYFDPSLAGQTITLASQLDINKNLSIDGSGLTPRVTISGNQAVRIFSIGFSDAVALKSLILKDGMMSGTTYTTFGGAIYTNNYTVLTMTDVALIGNRAYQAGAIYVSPYANVTILEQIPDQMMA